MEHGPMGCKPWSHPNVVNVSMCDYCIFNGGGFGWVFRWFCWSQPIVNEDPGACFVFNYAANVSYFTSSTQKVQSNSIGDMIRIRCRRSCCVQYHEIMSEVGGI